MTYPFEAKGRNDFWQSLTIESVRFGYEVHRPPARIVKV